MLPPSFTVSTLFLIKSKLSGRERGGEGRGGEEQEGERTFMGNKSQWCVCLPIMFLVMIASVSLYMLVTSTTSSLASPPSSLSRTCNRVFHPSLVLTQGLLDSRRPSAVFIVGHSKSSISSISKDLDIGIEEGGERRRNDQMNRTVEWIKEHIRL